MLNGETGLSVFTLAHLLFQGPQSLFRLCAAQLLLQLVRLPYEHLHLSQQGVGIDLKTGAYLGGLELFF